MTPARLPRQRAVLWLTAQCDFCSGFSLVFTATSSSLFLIITGKDTEFLFSLRFRNCPVLKFALKLIADSWGREVAIVIVYLKN